MTQEYISSEGVAVRSGSHSTGAVYFADSDDLFYSKQERQPLPIHPLQGYKFIDLFAGVGGIHAKIKQQQFKRGV